MRNDLTGLRGLHRIVLDFSRGIVGERGSYNMCFMVSAPLEGYLRLLGYKVKLTEGEFGHVWLTLDDGRIIDATADQFNGQYVKFPKVYIGPKPKAEPWETAHDFPSSFPGKAEALGSSKRDGAG